MYDSADQAYLRLRNTWVRHGDRLIKVLETSGDDDNIMLRCTTHQGNAVEVALRDPTLNLEHPELGYFNDTLEIVSDYCYKAPGRSQRQGLAMDSIASKNGINFSSYNKALEDCVFNRYPSMNECLRLVSMVEQGSLAFCQDYAVIQPDIGPIFLEHMGEKVGWFENNAIVLDKKYMYLKENLEHKYGVQTNDTV